MGHTQQHANDLFDFLAAHGLVITDPVRTACVGRFVEMEVHRGELNIQDIAATHDPRDLLMSAFTNAVTDQTTDAANYICLALFTLSWQATFDARTSVLQLLKKLVAQIDNNDFTGGRYDQIRGYVSYKAVDLDAFIQAREFLHHRVPADQPAEDNQHAEDDHQGTPGK